MLLIAFSQYFHILNDFVLIASLEPVSSTLSSIHTRWVKLLKIITLLVFLYSIFPIPVPLQAASWALHTNSPGSEKRGKRGKPFLLNTQVGFYKSSG